MIDCKYKENGSCAAVQQITQLSLSQCTVKEDACIACQRIGEPSPKDPNRVLVSLTLGVVRDNAPERYPSFADRYAHRLKRVEPQRDDDDERYACIHRSKEVVRVAKCAPCKGGNANVYQCGKLGVECTVHASRAAEVDENFCVFCEHMEKEEITTVEPQKPEGITLGSWSKSHPKQTGFLRTQYGEKADNLWGKYRGRPVFLISGGPSLNEMDLKLLDQRGIITAAVNQVAATHIRPDLWFSVDGVEKFHPAIFNDPAITKFVRTSWMRKAIRDEDLERTKKQCRSFPDVYFYNPQFGAGEQNSIQPEMFLTSRKPIWGAKFYRKPDFQDHVESKSVMLVALWMLYWLGFRTIFLVGATFSMRPENPYAFDLGKEADPGYCGGNNSSFRVMREWFKQMRPEFEQLGLRVYNCTKTTKLVEFPRCTLHNAVSAALDGFPKVTTLAGLY